MTSIYIAGGRGVKRAVPARIATGNVDRLG